MVAVTICDKNDRECKMIGSDCKSQVAQCSDEELRLSTLPDDAALRQTAETETPMNLLYYDFCGGDQTEGLRLVRKQYGDAMVMLITEANVSPLLYLRPGIAPDSLLLRPVQETQLRAINQEFVQSYFEKRGSSTPDSFLVDTREEKVVVPYSHIYYFEAREKKVFLRTKHTEYAFYSTIDALEKTLPDSFQRCHRSYIVNMQKLVRVVSSENCLELAGEITIPVSRSYRALLKEVPL